MSSPDWTTISTIASTVALVMGGFLWLASKVFRLGQTTQRLDTIESDIASIKTDVHAQIQSVRRELSNDIGQLNQRMDKLILTIAESNRRQN
jgi:septal ring factor EnvC (AmiA/AmiB activator)